MITIPTIGTIRDQILADIESATGQTAPVLPKAVWRVLATAMAGVQHLLYRAAAWAYRQIFTATADDEALIRRGAEYGLTRTAAVAWRGTATATGTNGTTIPAGTAFAVGGQVYEVETAVTISGATAITLAALTAGADSTLANATVVSIVTPLAGVDADATVTATLTTGADAEDIETFRTRLAARQANQPQGGAISDWVGWATEVPGIGEAIIERPAPGEVNIYPITDDADPANRIPIGAQITEVQDYVTDPVRSPIRAGQVTVVAPTELNFDVDIANLSPDNATIRATIEDAIEAYMYARRPKQYSDQVEDLSVVSAAEVTGIVIDSGAQIATVTLKNAGGSPITSYTLELDELAVLRTLAWV